MRKVLLILEVIAVVVAAIFSVLWLRDPYGPYEPVTFLSLLFGTTVVELIRRRLPEPKAGDDHLAQLRVEVSQLLALIRNTRSQESPTPSTPETTSEVSGGKPAATGDELSDRIRRLVEIRQALMRELKTLARLRNVRFDESNPVAACRSLSISKPFDDAVIQILEFTSDLPTRHEIDIRFSEWFDRMANAAIAYLDHVIGNLQQPALTSHPVPWDQTAPRAPLRVRFRDGVVCNVQLSASIQVPPEMASSALLSIAWSCAR
jgi:hypothetical protein